MMVTTASPAPLTSEDVAFENSTAYYDYDYDYLDSVASLVCRKDDIQSFRSVFLPAFYSLVFGLGLGGNLLLLVVLLCYVPRRRMAEVYLLNLAISNLLFVLTLPFWLISVAWHWVFGSFLCKVASTLYTTSIYSGIFFISCMSLDKYLEIVHAQRLHRLRTRAESRLLAALVWAGALALSVPEMVFVGVHEYPKGVWSCHPDFGEHGTIWKFLFHFQLNLLGFLLPLLAMVFFYARIGCVLVRLQPRGRGRALRMAVALVAAFFTCWFPYNLTLFLCSLLDLQASWDCQLSRRLDYAVQVTESLAFLHCSLTPILYAFSSPRFRRHLKALLAAVLRRRLAPGFSQGSLSGGSVSSVLTAREDLPGPEELAEWQAEGSVNQEDVGTH